MFFRNASFMFAAGIAHPASAQVTPPFTASPSGVQAEPDSQGQTAENSSRIVEPADAGSRKGRLPAPAFGANPAPRFAPTTPALNPDGPYFLENVAGNRRQPGYEPVPHRVARFVVSPSVTLRAQTDDNWTTRGQSLPLLSVLGSAAGSLERQFGIALPDQVVDAGLAQTINPALADVGDVAFELAPALNVSSDWSRNALSFDASARVTRFASIHRLNREEFQLGTRGRVDLGAKAAASTRLTYQRQAEPFGANGLALLDYFGFGPSLVNRFSVGGDVGFKFTRTSVVLDSEYAQDRYRALELDVSDLVRPSLLPLPGVPDRLSVSQSYRDRSQISLRVRITYALAPDFDLYLVPSFAKIRQSQQISDADFAAGIPSFSSETLGVLSGARKDFGHLIVVQAGVRFQDRNYDSPALVRSRRFDIEGAVEWYPTPLISVRLNAAQQFRGSGILGQADIVTRTVGARADYEVLRNVGLRFEGSASWDRFPGAAGQVQPVGQSARQDGSVQVVWNIGRSTEVNFSAGGHRRRASNSIFLGNFAASRFGISLTRRI